MYVFGVSRRVAWSRCCVTMCLYRRLARHCNMVTQQRDHATLLEGTLDAGEACLAPTFTGQRAAGKNTCSPNASFAI